MWPSPPTAGRPGTSRPAVGSRSRCRCAGAGCCRWWRRSRRPPISFHAAAIVHPAGAPQVRRLLKELGSLSRPSGGPRPASSSRPRGRVRDLRPGRLAVQAARPGRRSGARAGDAMKRGHDDRVTRPSRRPGTWVMAPSESMSSRWRPGFGEILNRHPAVGLAVGVVRNGSLEFFSGHGLADIASNTPVTEDTVFRIGSITKTFTAIAVLQLWEQGLVDLDAPANDYLRAYRLIPAKAAHRPATVRQLLTHTAGLPRARVPLAAFRPILGETVRFGQPAADAGGVLPRRAPSGGRAGHQVHVQQSWVRHPRPDRRGRERGAPGPLFPRPPLRPARHGRHRPPAIRSGQARASPPGTQLRSDGAHPVGDCDVVTVGAGSIYSTTTRHGPLCGGAACWWRQRARLDPQTGDPGQHVRAPVPARSSDTRYGPGLLPRRGRRASRRRARRVAARLQLAAVAGSRRRGRGGGLHQRGQERLAWLGTEVVEAAQAPPRRPGRGDPDRCPAPPGALGRAVWLVRAPRLVPRCTAVVRRRSRGLRPPRSAHDSGPEPDPRAEPRPSPPP